MAHGSDERSSQGDYQALEDEPNVGAPTLIIKTESVLETPAPSKYEPMSWGEIGLFVGATLGPVYYGVRAAFNQIALPLIGAIPSISSATNALIGGALGVFLGPTQLFRAFEGIDAWTAPRSEKDKKTREKYPYRFTLLRYLTPATAAASMLLVNIAEKTDGLGVFSPTDFLEFSRAEKIILPAIYGSYLGATLAVRAGTALDIILGSGPWKLLSVKEKWQKMAWAEIGLFAGTAIMPIYLEWLASSGFNPVAPMIGAIDSDSSYTQTAIGFSLGGIVGPFWFYRLFEIIDAWTLSNEKREGANLRYLFLRILPVIASAAAIYLAMGAKYSDGSHPTDAAGIFDPDQFTKLGAFQIVLFTLMWGAYVGATAAVRWGNMADRTREFVETKICHRGPFQVHHAVGEDTGSPSPGATAPRLVEMADLAISPV